MNGTFYLHSVTKVELSEINSKNSNARTIKVTFKDGQYLDITLFGETKEAVDFEKKDNIIVLNDKKYKEIIEDEIPF